MTTLASDRPGLFSRLGNRAFDVLVAISERSELAARARLAQKLDKMSEEELARVGIRREGIMPFAFGAYASL
jgi:uncharacterized protein YjiS (DUF1127 family)